MLKPFSQACINNRDFILSHLERLLAKDHAVLEIGSGTGQHAAYFSQCLPSVTWQTSDLEDNHQGINQWLEESGQKNALRPIVLDISQPHWPNKKYDAVFTANTLHILSWPQVTLFFQYLPQVLTLESLLVIYGPFKYEGSHTSESNERFEQFLQAANPSQGIRDIEKIIKLALDNGFSLLEDQAMPANNRLLVFALTPDLIRGS
jgi:cyclopropane fatty-acyl-phospholipid synthase-like methyltransferase